MEDLLLQEYQRLLPQLAELRETLDGRLRTLLSGRAGFYELRSRIKTPESIVARQRVLGDGRSLLDVQDLLGFRVLVSVPEHFQEIIDALTSALNVLDGLAPLAASDLRTERVHFHFDAADERNLAGPAPRIPGLRAEVQVETLRAFARHEIEHEILYKPGAPTPLIGTPSDGVARLHQVLLDFEALLERPDVHEKRDVHPFLHRHDFLLSTGYGQLVSEAPLGLGTQFKTDFIIQESDGTYTLVEIENPRHALFTAQGDFTAALNHALRQVEDWQEWIEDNLPTVQKTYPGISSPRALVVIGRSRNLDPIQRRKLARRNINMRGRVEIKTYDELLGSARDYLNLMRRHLST